MSNPAGSSLQNTDKLSKQDTLLAIMVVMSWGFNFIAVKYGVNEFPPIFMTSLRFMMVAAMVLPFGLPKREHLKTVIVLSFAMGTLHFSLFFMGFQSVDASAVAVALQMSIPFSVLIGWLGFKERMSIRKIIGIALALCGVVVLAGEPGDSSLTGLGLVVLGALAWAIASALFKILPHVPTISYVGGMALFTFPQTAFLSWIFESGQMEAVQNATIYGWGGILYTAIGGSIIGHGAWYVLAQRNDLSLVVPFTLLSPPIGIASAIIILGEELTIEKVIGAIFTLVGVAIIQIGVPKSFRNFTGRSFPKS